MVWRKGPGSRRIPVGKIKRNVSSGTRFEYIQKKLEQAEGEGFIPYTGFPPPKKKYTENVIEIFAQRIPKSERNDLSDFYSFWKVDLTKKEDPYYMLAQTQGLLPIDNFEFLADFNPIKGLNFISEIAGITREEISSELVSKGDRLTYELDPTNRFDKSAVKLYKEDLFLGYVKLIHSRVFYKAKGKVNVTVHHIEKDSLLKRVFIELEIQ